MSTEKHLSPSCSINSLERVGRSDESLEEKRAVDGHQTTHTKSIACRIAEIYILFVLCAHLPSLCGNCFRVHTCKCFSLHVLQETTVPTAASSNAFERAHYIFITRKNFASATLFNLNRCESFTAVDLRRYGGRHRHSRAP